MNEPGTYDEAKQGHIITFGYTTDDDGVWMECSCRPWAERWKVNLGFNGTLEQAIHHGFDHYRRPVSE